MKKTKKVAGNYWELPLVVAGGFAFGDYHGELTGEARGPLMQAGLIAMFVGPALTDLARGTREDSIVPRFFRNFFGGLTGMLGANYNALADTNALQQPVELLKLSSPTITGILAYASDKFRRKEEQRYLQRR